MNIILKCPKCNCTLIDTGESLKCEVCNKEFEKNHSCIDLIENNITLQKNSKIDKLLEYTKNNSYEEGIKEFLKVFPDEKKYLVNTKFDQSTDIIFHCINNNYKTCLIIGDVYGNISEILSEIFDNVYSLDVNEKMVKFKQRRFSENKINNVIFIKTNLGKLPFNENTFDLILIKDNSVYDEIYNSVKKTESSEYLEKIKNMLTEHGCLCLSLQNKFGMNLLSDKDGTPQSSIKKFSYQNYLKIFKKLGFNVKTYWSLPSEERPYFSSEMNDQIALKWYFQNFSFFMKGTKIKVRHKILFSIIRKMPGFARKFLFENFAPYFIFCCYKKDQNASFESSILTKTKFKHCLMISRRIKIIFILFNTAGNPKFIVHVKRYGKKFTSEFPIYERIFPSMENPKDRVWLETWKNGRTLNPFNHNEVISAINWLTNFQKDTSQGIFKLENILDEITMIREEINNIDILNKKIYKEWIKEYELILKNHEVKMSAIHGDFWYANMLYDKKNNTVNLVDWENYRRNGNPFHDLTTFIMRWMMMSDNDQINAFEFNLTKNNKFKNLMKEVQRIINIHYGFKINVDILLKYHILRNTVKVVDKQGTAYTNYLKMLKILEKNRLNVFNKIINLNEGK